MEQKIVLFLYTGNYYRSRFAELLFNHRSSQSDLGWEATSRALALDLGGQNIGPISPATLQALAQRGFPPKRNFGSRSVLRGLI